MAHHKRYRRNIGTKLYCFTRTQGGFRVTPMDTLEARLQGSYAIRCASDGLAVQCSCPHHSKAGAFCKHLREAREIHYEEKSTAPLESVPTWTPSFYQGE